MTRRAQGGEVMDRVYLILSMFYSGHASAPVLMDTSAPVLVGNWAACERAAVSYVESNPTTRGTKKTAICVSSDGRQQLWRHQ